MTTLASEILYASFILAPWISIHNITFQNWGEIRIILKSATSRSQNDEN